MLNDLMINILGNIGLIIIFILGIYFTFLLFSVGIAGMVSWQLFLFPCGIIFWSFIIGVMF